MPDIPKILKEINRHTTGSQKVVYGPWFDTYHNIYHIHQFLKDTGSGKNLDVTFNGIELLGDNTKSVMKEESVGIENITNALFGTWSGTFYYDVELIDADIIEFLIDEDVFKTKPGMTWAEWCDSEYNTRRFEVSNSGSVYIKNEGALKTSDMESVKGNEVIDTSKTYVMDYYPM